MTLKEYIEAGHASITHIVQTLGVTEHAVRKWVYGQRAPHLETALRIEAMTGGAVTAIELTRQNVRHVKAAKAAA